VNVVDLSSGQVVEPLPGYVRLAGEPDDRVTAYAAAYGQADLREAVAGQFARRGAAGASPDEITVTAGARHGLFATIAAVAAGGEVLMPRPHWSHYPKVVKLAGATAVPVPGDPANGWLADPEALTRARTPRTRALLLNSPVNPTGAVYAEASVQAIRTWAAGCEVHLIVDDIYWAYGADSGTPRATGAETLVGGAAKVHALAGLRIGWIWSRPPVTGQVRDIVEHTTGPVSTLGQAVAAAVLGDDDAVLERARRLAALRESAATLFAKLPLLRPVPAQGGIYLCLDAAELLERGLLGVRDDVALGQVLAERAGVRLRAGSTFGLPGHLRLCFADSPQVLQEAADRLTTFLEIVGANDAVSHHY
jgi:aspartate aminotransferase